MKSVTRQIYEKLLYDQLSKYFDSLLATNQCGFRKGFSSQYCLLVMLEKFNEAIDRGNQFGALLTDLSKAFDCIDAKFYRQSFLSTAFQWFFFNIISKLNISKKHQCFLNDMDLEYGVSSSTLNVFFS